MRKEVCEKANQFGICPYVTAQELLAGKWAILILHELCDGPKRFGQLQKSIEITQATLATQLKHLDRDGLIHRELFPEVPPRVEYSLTEIGAEFAPVLESIERWGKRYIAYLHEKNETVSS